MGMALMSALRSSDPSTKVGSVIVSPDNSIVSTGYNGFPRGYDDTNEEWNDRPLKYKLVIHAEANAIFNAGKHGKSTEGCKIYLPWFPCMECAKAIVQAGITEVHCLLTPQREEWKNSMENGNILLAACGIDVVTHDAWSFQGFDLLLMEMPIFFNGQSLQVKDLYADI